MGGCQDFILVTWTYLGSLVVVIESTSSKQRKQMLPIRVALPV